MTQAHLVELVHALDPQIGGFHPSALVEWEKSHSGRSPNPEQLEVWARALNFDLVLRARAA